MEQKSAIMKMLFRERGDIDNIPMSENYKKSQSIMADKYEILIDKLKNDQTLLKLFEDWQEAMEHEYICRMDDVYIEAFSFGLAMGQEVFSK